MRRARTTCCDTAWLPNPDGEVMQMVDVDDATHDLTLMLMYLTELLAKYGIDVPSDEPGNP